MGCSSAHVHIVNAEVDSMGGVVEGGVGNAIKSSPHKVAIDKVQVELRKECGVRDERKRELEFLENGGNPLDYNFGIVASVSVQSTSITGQHPDQFVTSEAKGSLAFAASPHGDSVESGDRPGTTPCDPNSADNLLLFDAENEFSEGGRSLCRRSSVMQSEQSFQMDGGLKTQEQGDSAIFSLPRKAYKRRNRSRSNRDGARSSSTDVNPPQGLHGAPLPYRHVPKDAEVLSSDADNKNIMSRLNLKPTSPSNGIISKAVAMDCQDIELEELKSSKSTKDQVQGVPLDAASDVYENPLNGQLNQQSLLVVADARKQIDSCRPEAIQMAEITSAAIECLPSATTIKVENQSSSCQYNGFGRKIGDDTMTDTHNNGASHGLKVLDSESYCTQTSLSIDGNNESEMCTPVGNLDSNVNLKNQTPQDGITVTKSDKFGKEMKDTEEKNSHDFVNKECTSACHSKMDKDSLLPPKNEIDQFDSVLEDQVKDQSTTEGMEAPCTTQLYSEAKPTVPLIDNPGQPKETSSTIRHQETFNPSKSELPDLAFSNRASAVPIEAQTSPGADSKLASRIDEDSVLKEAQIIEAKRKSIAELSIVTSPVVISQKSKWDYVLEEMAWLANDFAQERIWKLAAASQISYRVAVASRLRKQESRLGLDAKVVAHSLAKAVMEFWRSIKLQIHDTSKELEQHRQKNGALSIQAYAASFLKCDKPDVLYNQAEVPLTPDRISDSGIDLSWDDSLTEENLFYAVPPGAVVAYRMAFNSHVAQFERFGSSAQEEVETSACDTAADFESHDNGYDEDEGETNIYSTSMAFEGTKSSRYGQKKRKHLVRAYGARPYELGSDLLPMQPSENRLVIPQFAILAKRPGSNINVSIPTKRMRTASRRVISPFGAGASGCIQVPNKTDASSCDTNSFQDDHSTLHGGLTIPNSLEVESAGEFEKELPFDSAEVSTKPKKKKKAKYPNASHEQRWPSDSSFQNEQFHRDLYQKRTEIHHPEANGNNGLLGQHIAKKPKLMRQSQDNSFDIPSALSVPSPAGSQISNMSNPNQFIKMLGGRDWGRKPKSLKMPSGHSVSGSLWSLFEDQALVVLAHDLGPNWELVSDAFNSTLRFKCIFRKAKECKERHICLMDKSSGDGADSADESGSSQPYPSTLPGIPKGSARQLFQRLQGPMEEDTLKSHFEKIIVIGQKQLYLKTQNDNQDLKQFQRPHSSHTIALSQVCPNNPNGGPVLTPLDLCDANFSGPDVLPLGYQGAHSSGLVIPNQATMTQMLPASGATAPLQGASNMSGNNFSSSPGPHNTSARDARYGLPRSGSLPAEENQRMHLYNQMIAGRSIPQSSISAPGAVPGPDRSARILSSGNGMGSNRNMPIARPGVQGIPSSSMVNSGSAVSSGLSSGNMHTGVGALQGSSMVRQRPGMSQDPHRQMMASDLQTPSNSQGVSHFGGLSSSFTNPTTSPPVSSYPLHHQPSHPISPQQPQVPSPHQSHFQGPANHAPNNQQQAYAYRLAKERQLQHRFLQQQQQQQQFAASNSLISNVQSLTQLPVSSSPMQNSPQVQPQTSSSTVPLSPLTSVSSMNAMPQHQQKHQMPNQGVSRNAQSGGNGLNNQMGKQRVRQPHQPSQANRQHPPQRQQLQAQQQAKVVKGVGRGNLMMHQNISTDVVLPNGVSPIPGNQCLEKAEPVSNSMQSQGLYTGSAQNSVQPSRQYMASQPNQTLPQQKMYSDQASPSLKHPQLAPQPDSSSPSHGPATAPASSVQQPSSSLAVAGSTNQAPSHQKFVNQNQPALQRPGQPNRQITPDGSSKPQSRDSDVNHHPASGFAGMDAMTTSPQVSKIGSNAVPVVSQPNSHNWHASEPLVDSTALNSPKSLVSKPSNSSEPVLQAGQGLGHRPPSSLPIARHDTIALRQQPQQSLQPPSLAPQPQQPPKPVHSQPKAQLLQAGSRNSYGRSSDTRLE
ncbi:chromatin modification-related protein EAF1 B-like isoform X1 [Salvia splendens]|uniref:chromatin modification-related protein EAF1 B-like isoform X1 n=2 Tax=Salvia splendens TaxID=180675 RepID=UPI001C269E3F|nr:chromatin modification-related protein EAF1 B-like isoform X1 [Salvia splendens]XP_042043601.1 chromatin modification-related protein EAF1 B-like isoform X1 [Salvia splendens]XP_042043608.1 chromatin modification-related protein EAF1 B-like isoform X1 [Salvia splendens]